MPILNSLEAIQLFEKAKNNAFALPAVNVINTNSINACLESAVSVSAPIIIQISNGGGAFFGGKSLPNKDYKGAILGTIAAAKYIHEINKGYGDIPVIIHTDHAAKSLIPWVDGMIEEGKVFYKYNKRPLFTSHMLDLSEESLIENLEICKRYLEIFTSLDMILEIELGVTGGEEDGVDNSNVDCQKLYTKPDEVEYAYSELKKISDNFTIAAAFGNVHGVYKPGNVKLEPKILKECQDFIVKRHHLNSNNPVNFVFHGGSGSTQEEIREAIGYGVIKMNIDTDLQWSFWKGVLEYYEVNSNNLQSQIGTPIDSDFPNKKFYDPRVWLRKGEESFKEKLIKYFEILNCTNIL